MQITTHTRVEASAHCRFSPASSGPIVTQSVTAGVTVQRLVVNIVCTLDEEGVDFSGYGYKIKKDGTVGEQGGPVRSIDPTELGEGLRSALVSAAREALDAAIAAR
jgi:hypothetical protein